MYCITYYYGNYSLGFEMFGLQLISNMLIVREFFYTVKCVCGIIINICEKWNLFTPDQKMECLSIDIEE